jgi:polysaccharide deacetylase 2 family uncharacterized protein YibQ
VFLDVEVTAGFFDKQFTQLIKVAKKKNTAIAIGHFRMDTARGLAQRLPELAQNGIKLVHGSELVQ